MSRIAYTMGAAPLYMAVAMLGWGGAAAAQTPLFEVERSDATRLFRVADDAGLVAGGALNAGVIPATGAGVRLMWFPGKVAFRAGQVLAAQWDDANTGQWSVAFGYNTTASGSTSLAVNTGTTATGIGAVAMGGETLAGGDFSLASGFRTAANGVFAVAFGRETQASGPFSMALGYRTKAGGNTSLAAGIETAANGLGSTALGTETQASGANSFAAGYRAQATGNVAAAMGTGTVASGAASVALGSAVTAQGDGSFIFGDRSTSYTLAAGANQFLVRAFGGIGFNTGVSIGCDLPAGTGAWSCTSSRLAKEGFEDVDGEEVLAKLAGIRIQRWRYLDTDAAHLGPTAEDFHAAFGLGESSTKIAGVDADGVALRAIQALERRTAVLEQRTAALEEENAALRRRLDSLERRR